MTQSFTIPGGKEKGAPLADASDNTLNWWAETLATNLETGKSRNVDGDRALVNAMTAELARRKRGGSATKAASPPQQRSATTPATTLATRGGDKMAGSFSEASAASQALREASEQMHLVSPATVCGSLPEGCGVAISIVHVNPDASSGGPGEVYSVGGDKFGLSGTTLKKIGAAASVDWDMNQSGRLDDGRNPHYCHYRAVGHVKNFDGSRRTVSGEVEMDMRDGSPQLAAMRQRASSDKGYEAQLRDTRLFILRHAETKAKLRAIADMGIRRSYTKAELSKPFAVARLMWTGQTKDPELRRLFAEKQFESMVNGSVAMYGRPPAQPAPGPALPQHSGHAPPPVGAVNDDLDELPERTTFTVPQHTVDTAAVASSAAQAPVEGLPPEQDRGDDPDQY